MGKPEADAAGKCGRCQEQAPLLFSFDYDDGHAGDRYCRKCFAGLLTTMSGDLFLKVKCVNTFSRVPHGRC